ncbi:MAG: helix-turn-helix transcriptional regulator [Actinomycetia bacterium]|jgi:AcrR family transcriptional regulator|nr:helix-turn-helix transcriptional regulator [Actinomycetes bacterium]MDP6106069.1 TetR family transcriptional regulator [Acidimicrobiales bacterium]MDP6239881.1 TetR family transcriptional regulator [Acidimicrobiales bacterium]MDP7508329.1 TetR family transcriptional regulator [Acidimicrobiales bacterium]|tara:strand:+ start:13742 stop:14365 length:624 start_codon:yes stop_codon:yes gene_type:complete
MPRDSTETRARLQVEAERLFAEQGVWRAGIGEIVAAAGQRNASALTYHFGSREGVLDRILAGHEDSIDAHRGELLEGLSDDPPTHAVLDALVRPMSARLAHERGRRYLRIVAQLTSRFSLWREVRSGLEHRHLLRALDLLERRPAHIPAAVRRERLVAMMQLMTSSLAERARLIDASGEVELSAADYEANLTDMLAGVLEAPVALPA